LQTKLIPALLAPAVLLALAAPALAGNGNTLYLIQESPPGTTDGNNFLSDQTDAYYSAIGTLAHPARQSGTGNSASVTIKSDCSDAWSFSRCGELTLVQDNSGSGLTGSLLHAFNLSSQSPNIATVSITGTGHADLQQLGGGNLATLTVHDGSGDIFQIGLDNTATLTLAAATTGRIAQLGSSNSADLTVNAVGGGGASLLQAGSHLESGPISVDTTSSVAIWMFGSGSSVTPHPVYF
jgi:hypothetical protein